MTANRWALSWLGALAAVGLCLAAGAPATPQEAAPLQAPRPAVPADPVAAILDALRAHDVVALGEGNHQNIPGHEFRLALLRDPRTSELVDDIVVEFGNPIHQATLDRFIAGGEVSDADLRKVWWDVSEPQPTWDVPIYEEFFRAIRDLNRTLPEERRYRVIVAHRPFDWSRVQTLEDMNRQPRRSDALVAELIERESLARGRRPLVIFGDLHFLRRPIHYFREGQAVSSPSTAERDSIVSLLEGRGHTVFSIYTATNTDPARFQPDVAGWQRPQLALLEGTVLGAVPFVSYGQYDMMANLGMPDASGQVRITGRADPERTGLMQDQFDALLYLGPPDSIAYSTWTRELCSDEDYLRMRFSRLEIAGMADMAEAGRQLCEALVRGS